jgi:starvation-inducible DNA-binding protein
MKKDIDMSSDNYKSGQANEKIVEGMKHVLANTFVLYFKTHGFHWNVEGRDFKALHDMFGEQYTALWEVTDELAERIRALGSYATSDLKSILANADLKEQSGKDIDAIKMVKELATDHEKIVDLIYPVLRIAEDAGDEVTVDMLIARITEHEKTAWMLNSYAA